MGPIERRIARRAEAAVRETDFVKLSLEMAPIIEDPL